MLPKEDYVAKFKQENKDKYKTTFDAEPPTRPSYIPQSYNNHTVVFNPTMRGYGYYDPLGTFIIYDALTDIATADYRTYHSYHSSNISSGTGWLYLVGVLTTLGIIGLIIKSRVV